VADLYLAGDQLELSHGFLDDQQQNFSHPAFARQSVDRPIAILIIHRAAGLGMGAMNSRQTPPISSLPEFGSEFSPYFSSGSPLLGFHGRPDTNRN